MFVNSLLPIDPPSVNAVPPAEVLVNYSQMANFTCQAFGIPVPSLRWVEEIDDYTFVPVNVTDTINITEQIIAPFTLESMLVFSNTTKTDESRYSCEGSNEVTNVINSLEHDSVHLLVDGMVEAKLLQFGN